MIFSDPKFELFQKFEIAIVVHAPDSRVLFSNDRALDLLGLSAEQMIGRVAIDPAWCFVDEYGRDMSVDRYPISRILATHEPLKNLVAGIKWSPQAQPVWVLVNGFPEFDTSGAMLHVVVHFFDITERKQAEAALRGNTSLFYKIIEQAPGGVYVVDAQFRVAQMNAESLPFFASAQPLIGRDFDEALGIVWGPEIGPQIASIFRHTMATGERYVSPRFSEQRNDIGVEQAFEWETQRITLPDGQLGVVCYFKDVTERERAATARRESEERLRLAIAGSDLGTWHWDVRTGEMEWSERCLKIFGIPAGTAMSRENFHGALHPDDQVRADDAMRHALQNGSEYRIELRNVWPDGSVHWVVSIGRVYCDATDKPIRVEGIALDITERKRTEAALRETEQHFRALAEASSEIAYRMSADWSMILSLSGRQLVLSTDKALDTWEWLDQNIPCEEHPRLRKAISDAIAGKSLFELEHRVVRPDGSTGWTLSRAVPILDENQGVVTWFGAASDITERKQTMELLHQARSEADQANAAKSRFLAAASHDLRQPLSSLSLYANLLSISNPPTARTVANIKECIGSLSALLTDLLDISKLEARVVTPNIRSFPIAAMLTSLDSILSPKAKAKGLELRYRPSNWMAHCDPVLFRRILGNLIENAIQYTEHGGVLVACRHRRGKNWVEVWDTGIGIEADQTTEIFEEFKQLGDQARNKGSGLGLAIVAKTTDLLGLEVQVRSRPGRGSVFAVELPLGLEAQVELAPAASGLLFRALRIAVVEDNPIVRMALEDCLLDLGHQVVAADGKATLLAELGTLAPDIVVSDYRLAQGETGFDVITAVQVRFGSKLPAILITGDTDHTLMRSMSERGIVLLHKPLELETLRATIEDLTN